MLRLTPEEILKNTGYHCGEVPSFGYEGIFFIDSKGMEREDVYTGGGSSNSLVKISSKLMQEINRKNIVRIRK